MDRISAVRVKMPEVFLRWIVEVYSSRQRSDPQLTVGVFKYLPHAVISQTIGIIGIMLETNKLPPVKAIQTTKISADPKCPIFRQSKADNNVRAENVAIVRIVQVLPKLVEFSVEINQPS